MKTYDVSETIAKTTKENLRTFEIALGKRGLAPVVHRVDNAIHRINYYPVDSVVCLVI